MQIVICGAGGMLGSDISIRFKQKGYPVTDLSSKELDITNSSAVSRSLQELQPDLLVNASGYTHVDQCESEPELAYQVNCLGTRNLAVACNELGASMVHISSDYVFGGKGNKAYREYDSVNPLNVYGKSKYDGELMVRQHCERHYIIRTSWLFGLHGNNFVKTMLRLAGQQDHIKVVNDQMGSPTYTKDLAAAITELVVRPTYGTYHLTNGDCCTWYTFTQDILELTGMNNVRILPITTEQMNRPAERPRYSVLDNYIWRLDGHKPLRPYREALIDYLAQENLNKGE